MEYYRQNFACVKNKRDFKLFGTFLQDKTRMPHYFIATCDRKTRKSCKSESEIADFIGRSVFNVISLQSVVVEDQFSNKEGEHPRFEDEETTYYSGFTGNDYDYFPIQHLVRQFELDVIRTPNQTKVLTDYTIYSFTINELIIDDNMLTYDTRQTNFLNLERREGGKVGQLLWSGLVDGRDLVKMVSFDVAAEGKVITRTRRKVWDDFSLRGGQYSAIMILLTAFYSMFQGPFQDMKYGLKFAEMRVMDDLSSTVEQKLF